MLNQLAQEVRAHHHAIVARWMNDVSADEKIPTAKRLSTEELRDHLDDVLRKLGELLRQEAVLPLAEVSAPREASRHGASRLHQHYRVDELVREVTVLRSSFLEFFSSYLKELRQIATDHYLRTTQLVHRFFDEICSDSVTVYVEEREREVATAQERLEVLNATLERTNQQYEATDHYRRRTLRTVAHEIATPVNALGLGVSYLSESNDQAERDEAKHLISRTLDHLRTMLDQLVDFARADGGMERLRVTEFAVRPLFDYLVAAFEPLADGKGIDFEARLDPDLATLRTDENKVQRIAINLLSNAVKYCEVGEITLSFSVVDEGWWCLEVSDTGCGVPPEELDRIFAEFERMRRHTDQPGLGLGLAIVRTLTEQLGGKVTLRSVVDEGSTFRVVLPRR